jgi:HSP20 family protein
MTLTVSRWNPVNDLAAIEVDRLNRMFETAFGGGTSSGEWSPAIDIHETATKDLVVSADLPAVKREDIKVTFEDDLLTIEGERKPAPDVSREAYHRVERSYGTFRRAFTLPATVDGSRIAASYQDGVLTITLPRREDARARTIEVGV